MKSVGIQHVHSNFFFNKKNIVYDRSLRITKSLIGKRISIIQRQGIYFTINSVIITWGADLVNLLKLKKKGSVIHNRISNKKGKK